MMNHTALAEKVYKSCHLTGEFKLRSGKISNEYFDKYRLESNPEILNAIADHMVSMIPKGTEILAGLEMGGIPIATALSLKSGLPVCFVRKEAKNYGTCQFAEGIDVRGRNVCIIEDVITSGGQVVLSTADLRSLGAVISNVLCVINRGGDEAIQKLKAVNLSTHSLFVRSDFPS
jgi:orotate phosphoribosyltransferase